MKKEKTQSIKEKRSVAQAVEDVFAHLDRPQEADEAAPFAGQTD